MTIRYGWWFIAVHRHKLIVSLGPPIDHFWWRWSI
jgi:hypothetical protein